MSGSNPTARRPNRAGPSDTSWPDSFPGRLRRRRRRVLRGCSRYIRPIPDLILGRFGRAGMTSAGRSGRGRRGGGDDIRRRRARRRRRRRRRSLGHQGPFLFAPLWPPPHIRRGSRGRTEVGPDGTTQGPGRGLRRGGLDGGLRGGLRLGRGGGTSILSGSCLLPWAPHPCI